MKTSDTTKIICSAVLLAIICLLSSAQEEIIFSPADLEPHEDGYYKAGVWVDENEDGILEFHNGCEDYYEDDVYDDGFYDPHENHAETGEQQGFTYVNCMIMPTCEHKSTPIDPPVAVGYIQMAACLYSNTDSAILSYVQTPAITNLVSIYLETSADVSINESRKIPYNIEYSKDYGTTWEPTSLSDNVLSQGGYRVTYDGSVYFEIQEMIDASKLSTIVLRIITNDRVVEGASQGQFVKLHYLKLTADIPTSVSSINSNQSLQYRIDNHTIITNEETIQVYNLTGQLIGSGIRVTVPYSGIYLIKSNDSRVQKIVVR